ncbi:FUSC family protein [Kutzneria buriramensis]|uniref:Putative membrane protein YccC n=1 Tax=Kutzneria buriramensis TaxID=1045776 RepID=A0A3E0HZ76_9PSEU|nr:FUSC family protein [Kutzneria buriramensis]REH51777.1 putative membrane protein YccC [Kutzneria buriramensis]
MRHVFDAVLDRFAAADPGTLRLRQAIRTAASVVLAIAALALLGLPITAIMLGTIVAMMSAMSVNDKTARAKAGTFLLLPVSAGVSITTSALLAPWRGIADGAFLVIIFVAVYLRRYAPRGFAVGMVAFMTFFFSLFIHATVPQLPQLLFAVVVALCCSAFSHFVLVPRRPRLNLRRIVVAFRARLAQLVDAAAHLVEEPDDRRQEQLRKRVARLHECALMVETELADLVEPTQFDQWQMDVVDIELTGERLAIAARRLVAGGAVPDDLRAGLVGELRELRVLAGRDPRPALAYEDDDSMTRLAAIGRQLDAVDNPPHVTRLRRAVRELAVSITSARAELESDLPAVVMDDHPGRHRQPDDEPPASPTAPPAQTGLRLTTRQAIQAVIGAGLAILGGEFVSTQRWYWAVITAFLVFANTTSRGDILIRGFRRTVGTLLGILAGMVAASLVSGQNVLILILIIGCISLGVYVVQVSYGLMTFFMTMMLALLYSLIGTFTPEVLVLRLEETMIGAFAGGIAAVLVLPTKTRALIKEDIAAVLEALRRFISDATGLLRDADTVDLIDQSREIDKKLADLRKAAEPMTHVISPYRNQRSELRHLLALLGSSAYYARSLAANAEPALLASDDRLPRTSSRIVENLGRLIAAVGGADGDRKQVVAGDALSSHVRPRHLAEGGEPDDAVARRIMASFDHLDELIVALARPLGLSDDTDTEPSDEVDAVTSRLLGQVRDADGSPLADAALTLVDGKGRQVGRSVPADDGRFRIEVPQSGTYLLIASSPGRHPSADLVTVPAGPVTKDVVLEAERDAWR